MTPREAQITDPQHRVLLECAADALANGGYVGEDYDGSIAVYAGVGMNTYLLSNLMSNPDVLQNMGMHQVLLGNDKCYATSRISYKLDLKGACMTIDTACSSSLVAIMTAYKSLISYDCDMALAGGAKVNAADTGYLYEPGSINSPDGHCRAFDAEANGTVFGSGGAMVLLKRLEDALDDNDNIFGIIRGGAINNDGADKVGFTAPSVGRQCDVVEQALSFTEVPAQSISYVEAHGTGTRLGDPIELGALTEAFEGAAKQSCFIGSAKTNIGHLESAAGVAGLIKVLLALDHQLLPPSLHYSQPNPAIDFADSPFKVVSEATDWLRGDKPRRACVSSFGIGGTNAHLIVEEAPWRDKTDAGESQLLLLSAKCSKALSQSQQNLIDALSDNANSKPRFKDAAYTLAVGRKAYEYRSYAAAGVDNKISFGGAVQAGEAINKIAWVVPGQGNQHLGMSRALYQRFDTFAQTLDNCCDLLVAQGATDIKPLLLAEPQLSQNAQFNEQINDTANAQPAIFVHAYAMAKQMQQWQMQPDIMLGHSLGEYVVATLAGVLSLENALALVVTRAKLMASVAPGSMAGIVAPLDKVQQVLKDNGITAVDIAAINGPESIVLSATDAAIEQALTAFDQASIDCRKLVTSHAFHSHMLDGVLDEFKTAVSKVVFSAPNIPYVSSLTGQLITNGLISDAQYWVDHLRQTVKFAAGVETLVAQEVDCMFDLGPSTVASMLVRSNVNTNQVVINCSANVKQQTPSDRVLLEAVGQFWANGGKVDWASFYQGQDCYRCALPGYALQKQRHWVDAVVNTQTDTAPAAGSATEQYVAQNDVAPSNAAPSNDYEGAPRDETEQLVGDIWQQLLGIDNISVFDNFFSIGGQSLLASRVISSIYEQTGVELEVSAIFDNPTIAGLSLALMEQQLLAVGDDELERLLAEVEE